MGKVKIRPLCRDYGHIHHGKKHFQYIRVCRDVQRARAAVYVRQWSTVAHTTAPTWGLMTLVYRYHLMTSTWRHRFQLQPTPSYHPPTISFSKWFFVGDSLYTQLLSLLLLLHWWCSVGLRDPLINRKGRRKRISGHGAFLITFVHGAFERT